VPAPAPTRILTAEGTQCGGLAALSITQSTGWGVLYYALIAAVRPISEDTGREPALVTGAFPSGCWSPQRPASGEGTQPLR
jgi:hypothetical protein